jgi:hypothetical protein
MGVINFFAYYSNLGVLIFILFLISVEEALIKDGKSVEIARKMTI